MRGVVCTRNNTTAQARLQLPHRNQAGPRSVCFDLDNSRKTPPLVPTGSREESREASATRKRSFQIQQRIRLAVL
jgi:hypothetical protein